jgi:hypothetical protein
MKTSQTAPINKLLKKVASDTSPKHIITTGKVQMNTEREEIPNIASLQRIDFINAEAFPLCTLPESFSFVEIIAAQITPKVDKNDS